MLDNGNDKDLDKDQFVRGLKHKVREYGHEIFYAVGYTVAGTIAMHDVLSDCHMFKITEMIDSYNKCKLLVGPLLWKEIEEDDMEMSRLVVESLVSEGLKDRMHIHYDHHTDYLDFLGGVLFMMALDICNASMSFYIEGAREKLKEITLDNYTGGGCLCIHGRFSETRQNYTERICSTNQSRVQNVDESCKN
jgi:hypothetical protein